MADGGAPAWGRRGDAGVREGGRRRLAARGPLGTRASQTKERGPGHWPRAPLFQGAQRPAAAPPWDAGCFPSFRARRLFFRSNFLQTKQARRSR